MSFVRTLRAGVKTSQENVHKGHIDAPKDRSHSPYLQRFRQTQKPKLTVLRSQKRDRVESISPEMIHDEGRQEFRTTGNISASQRP